MRVFCDGVLPLEMVWGGGGDVVTEIASVRREEAVLSMTLLLPLTTVHKSPLPDTGLGLKLPIEPRPRN